MGEKKTQRTVEAGPPLWAFLLFVLLLGSVIGSISVIGSVIASMGVEETKAKYPAPWPDEKYEFISFTDEHGRFVVFRLDKDEGKWLSREYREWYPWNGSSKSIKIPIK